MWRREVLRRVWEVTMLFGWWVRRGRERSCRTLLSFTITGGLFGYYFRSNRFHLVGYILGRYNFSCFFSSIH